MRSELRKMSSLSFTYARPGISKIKGVGMIAIRDIPKGTVLGKTKRIKGRWRSLEWAHFHNIDQNVITMMQDYVCSQHYDIEHNLFVPDAPFLEFHMQMLMNHSMNPNIKLTDDNYMVSVENIAKGEELTEAYCSVCSPAYANAVVYKNEFRRKK